MSKPRGHADDLRGVTRLAIEATRGVTAIVEAMHVTIASGPAILGRPLAAPARLGTRLVYAAIHGVTRLVGAGLDLGLAQLAPVLGASAPGGEREAVLGVLNGVLGDYLDEHANPLAIEMRLRHGGATLPLAPPALRAALPGATGKVVVLVHGLCMTDLQWRRGAHDHGAALARDLGYTPIYLHYNTGRHISTNGRAFAALLEELVAAWPVPIEELVILGHSMGGLVARSACACAEAAGHAWRPRLTTLVTLGSPHHGAPMERGGSWIDLLLGVSPYSAPLGRLGRIRSAGITDLRFGDVEDEHWQGHDRFAYREDRRTQLALPAGVACYAIAGTLAPDPNARPHPLGDGMVPVDSALGIHPDPERCLAFPDDRRWIAPRTGHLELLAEPVYAQLAAWLSPRGAAPA